MTNLFLIVEVVVLVVALGVLEMVILVDKGRRRVVGWNEKPLLWRPQGGEGEGGVWLRQRLSHTLSFESALQNEIVFAEAELQLLLHHLASFRARVSHSTPPPSSDPYLQELPFQELQEQPQEQQLQPQEKDSSCFDYNLQEYMNMLDTHNL